MVSYSIDKGNSTDLAQVMVLIKATTVAMRSVGILQWDDFYPDSETMRADLESGALYKLCENGIFVSIVTINSNSPKEYDQLPWRDQQGKHATVHRLTVHPDWQGRGIGKQMMRFVESFTQQHGHTSLRLDAHSRNEQALSLYRGMGFHEVGGVEFRNGSFICFEKHITKTPHPIGQGVYEY